MPVRETWDGKEWEAHCRELLAIRFGHDIQFVPDRVHGDGGMEAFRLDEGVVYQCYAAKDAFTNQQLTNAQKRKISDDTKTLCNKVDQTQEILGKAYRIRRWVLLTPEFDDKDVIKHARKVEQEVLADPRPEWCHDDFRIVVTTDFETFPDELRNLGNHSASRIRLAVEAPSAEEAVNAVAPELIEKLRGKLRVHPMLDRHPEELESYSRETLMDFVYGKRQLDALEDRYGATYSAVQKRARNSFRSLARAMAATDGGPSGVQLIHMKLSDGLETELPSLPAETCDELARHFIADWLINCPLRFRSTS